MAAHRAWAPSRLQHPNAITLKAGDVLNYMVRNRAPRFTIAGPVSLEPDTNTILVQGTPGIDGFVVPQPRNHLLYLGSGRTPMECTPRTTTRNTPRADVYHGHRSGPGTAMDICGRVGGTQCDTRSLRVAPWT